MPRIVVVATPGAPTTAGVNAATKVGIAKKDHARSAGRRHDDPGGRQPPRRAEALLRLGQRRPLLGLLGHGGHRLLKTLGNATCRRSLGRPVARLPVNALAAPLLPIGLLRRATAAPPPGPSGFSSPACASPVAPCGPSGSSRAIGPSASAASFTPWSTMRANCEKALSTDRHIFWKSLADMPGMGLPEGPTGQEPVARRARRRRRCPGDAPSHSRLAPLSPGTPLLPLKILGHLRKHIQAQVAAARVCCGPVCCDSP